MHYALIQIIDRRPEAISQLLSMYVDKWPTVSRPKCSIDKIYLWKNGLVIDNYEYVLSLHVPRNMYYCLAAKKAIFKYTRNYSELDDSIVGRL